MPRIIENKLNRTAFASAITLGTDYAAVQLYSQGSRPIQIDGINWGVRSTVPADYAAIAFNDLRILRGIRIDESLTIAQILALNFEEVYHSNLQGAHNAQYEDFGSEPITLEPGQNYVVINGDASAGATTGVISLFLTVRGRILDAPVEQQKYLPREAAPIPDTVQAEGSDEQKC